MLQFLEQLIHRTVECLNSLLDDRRIGIGVGGRDPSGQRRQFRSTPGTVIRGSSLHFPQDRISGGALPVALDMREVPFMNSAGLRVLIIAQRELDQRKQRLSVRSAQPAVDTLLRVAGLDTLMEVRP